MELLLCPSSKGINSGVTPIFHSQAVGSHLNNENLNFLLDLGFIVFNSSTELGSQQPALVEGSLPMSESGF